MRTKCIKVTFRRRKTNEELIEYFLDEYRDGLEDLIIIEPEDEDTGKVKVSYTDGEREVADYIYDMELCDGISRYRMKMMEEKMGIYLCYASINNIECEANKIHIFLTVEMPWDNAEVPSVPNVVQTYTTVQCKPEPMVYTSKIVGVKHYVDDRQYEELEERVMRMESVMLRKELDNPHDPDAIAAYTTDNQKIGYIPKEDTCIIAGIMSNNDCLEAELSYMDFMSSTINIRIRTFIVTPVSVEHLFRRYTPIEVYRANYLFCKWGGIPEKDEAGLFDKSEQLIHFDKFAELPLSSQNRLAEIWMERMMKATVENPTNPGFRMAIPLELSVYETSWSELDLNNEPLLKLIEVENKMVAIYMRMRRNGFRGTPEEFVEEMELDSPSETVMKRMHYIYDYNRL